MSTPSTADSAAASTTVGSAFVLALADSAGRLWGDWPLDAAAAAAAPWLAAAVGLLVLAAVVGAVLLPAPPLPSGVPVVRGLPVLGALVGFMRDPVAFIHRNTNAQSAFACYLLREPTLVLTNPVDYAHVYKHTERFSFRDLENAITAKATGVPRSHVTANFHPYINSLWHTSLQGHALAVLTVHAARHLARKARTLPAVARSIAGHQGKKAAAAAADTEADPAATHTAPLFDLVFSTLFASGVATVMGADLDPRQLIAAFRAFEAGFPLMVAGVPDIFLRTAFAGRDRMAAAVHAQLERAGLFGLSAKPAPELGADEAVPAVSPLQHNRTVHFIQSGELDSFETARLSAVNIWALHANTGPAGFWLLTFVLSSAEAYAAVRAEVDALFAKHPTFPEAHDPGDPSEGTDPEDLTGAVLDRALPALTSAMWESMRLTISQFGVRIVTDGCDIPLASGATASVRPGDRILLAPTHHTDPSVFKNPTEFQYDRFMPDRATGVAPVFYKDGTALRPPVHAFGGGITMCPGRFFAMNEIRLLVAFFLREWDMQLVGPVPGRSRARAGFGIMPPLHDPSVQFRRRVQL